MGFRVYRVRGLYKGLGSAHIEEGFEILVRMAGRSYRVILGIIRFVRLTGFGAYEGLG